MTQCEQIIDYIKQNGSITGREASHNLGIERLAARIADLKERGVPICKQTQYKRDESGKVIKKWARYWISSEVRA